MELCHREIHINRKTNKTGMLQIMELCHIPELGRDGPGEFVAMQVPVCHHRRRSPELVRIKCELYYILRYIDSKNNEKQAY